MGATEGNNPKITLLDKVLKSFSLILIVIYCPFAIAAMLNGPFGLSYNTMVVYIFISMGLSTLVSSIYANISLVLAPGIGLASFYYSLYNSGQAINALLASAFAGVVTFCLSLKPKSSTKTLREVILNKIPDEAQIGIRGSVGAILISTALKQITSSDIHIGDAFFKANMSGDKIYIASFILFLVATLLIYIFTCLDKALTGNEPREKIFLSLFFKSTHVFIPFILYLIICFFGNIGNGTANTVVQPNIPETHFNFWTCIGCFFIILYIIIVDIPGSLYDIARQVASTEKNGTDGHGEAFLIDRSFRVSSISAIFNSFLSISPSVYYAENYILFQSKFRKEERANVTIYIKNKIIGVSCGCVFLFFAGFFYFFNLESNITNIIKFIVSPNIFSLGIHLLSKSFYTENKQSTCKEQHQLAYYKFAPAAFSIIMTPMFGFEFTIPMCIFFTSLIHIFFEQDNKNSELIFYIPFLISSVITFVSFILPGHS